MEVPGSLALGLGLMMGLKVGGEVRVRVRVYLSFDTTSDGSEGSSDAMWI